MDSCRKSKIIEGAYYKLALPTLIALCSVSLRKPVLSSMAVLGEISISGIVQKVEELANFPFLLRVGGVPTELIGCFNLIFYNSAEDEIFKALGVE
ncbi:hypothetical protein [Acetatifactor muris]|uniref:hypothetical protein n=1 Tax=Acetatifactor muris TaxID=879566 RepID=UPI002ED4A9CA